MSVDKETETTNLVAAFAGQMTYSINSSEINTRLYDFRAKKRKIRSGSRKGREKIFSPEKLEMGMKKKIVTNLCVHFYYILTTSFRVFWFPTISELRTQKKLFVYNTISGFFA